jgi:uncharacterized protein with PIN domain
MAVSPVSLPPPGTAQRIAADAMCGGLARWLRVLGVDTSYRADIDDAALVRHALGERRIVVSSDHKLFERRVFVRGELAGLLMPTGLKLDDQVRFVVQSLHIRPGFPRCALCNGELNPVRRSEVGDVVPARSLIWAGRFYRCEDCRHVFWEGTHWSRIQRLVAELTALPPNSEAPPSRE